MDTMEQIALYEAMVAKGAVGIGVVGAASALYKAGLDYDGSEESLEFISRKSELHN